MTRRRLLAKILAVATASAVPVRGRATARTRLILLGTGGGPTPKALASAPAQVIIVDDVPYVVDCGDGVARQLVRANVSLLALRHIFVTHQHSDHNADYGNLLLLAWATGLSRRVDTWGPPPLARMTTLFLELNAYDIGIRSKDEGLPPLAPLVHAHDLSRAGVVLRDDRVTVKAALVDHPPVTPALAYRFDGPDRSIVISGDTAPCDAVIQLARGADVLVHEAMWLPGVDRLVARSPHATRLRQHLLASHTPAEECGRIAAAAGVKTLVLSHLVPGGDASITDETWTNAARKYFRGTVIVGKDLMEI